MSYQITTTIIGLLLGGVIFYLVRRDHMHGPYAVWWLGVAATIIVFGVRPTLIDDLARLVSVGYPPTLLFSIAIAFILMRMLKTDVEGSKHERRIRRLAQKVSILSEENRQLRRMLDQRNDIELSGSDDLPIPVNHTSTENKRAS